jgi:hypothetical protein
MRPAIRPAVYGADRDTRVCARGPPLTMDESLRLTPAGRLGIQVAQNKSDQPVLVCTEGKAMCVHGERAASIQAWLNAERADPNNIRPSVCTCQNLDGLMTDYRGVTPPVPSTDLKSLYKLLGTIGAAECVNNSRPQRLAIKTPTAELWVQPAGTVVCKHGNTRKVISKMAKTEEARHRRGGVTKCSCCLTVPRRVGSVFAAKGKPSA